MGTCSTAQHSGDRSKNIIHVQDSLLSLSVTHRVWTKGLEHDRWVLQPNPFCYRVSLNRSGWLQTDSLHSLVFLPQPPELPNLQVWISRPLLPCFSLYIFLTQCASWFFRHQEVPCCLCSAHSSPWLVCFMSTALYHSSCKCFIALWCLQCIVHLLIQLGGGFCGSVKISTAELWLLLLWFVSSDLWVSQVLIPRNLVIVYFFK